MTTISAHAKINWALNITGTRPDGYHEMDMLMQSISLCDALTFEPCDALSFDGGEDNLVMRAARALNAEVGGVFGARIELEKRIPERAGLGGGSADAAAALRALNGLWGLGLSDEALMRIGLSLGADVPFCLMGGAARAKGIGEVLEKVEIGRSYELVILQPGGGLSTPTMFRLWDQEAEHAQAADIAGAIEALRGGDFALLNRASRNMFTGVAVRALPEIELARRALVDAGAKFAAMTGSGSAVFGVYKSARAADDAANHIVGAIRAHTM